MTTTTIAPQRPTVTTPIRPTSGFPEMMDLMALRQWRTSVQSCAPSAMTDAERRLFNGSVHIPLPIDQQVFELLQHSADSGLTGTNSVTWLQGQAGAGKTDLAREVAAQFTDPDSVGAPALPSTTDINYAYIPIATISGQDDQIAGLAGAGCRWFGIDPGRTGSENADRLGQAIRNCGTRVLIIEDMQAVGHGTRDIDALRVLLNKISAHVIMISLPPSQARKQSVAATLMQGSAPAEQILARATIVRLSGIAHSNQDTATRVITDAIGKFKLHGACNQAPAIAQWIVDHSDQRRLRTLPLVFSLLRGLAVRAVGTSETIALHDVLRLELT